MVGTEPAEWFSGLPLLPLHRYRSHSQTSADVNTETEQSQAEVRVEAFTALLLTQRPGGRAQRLETSDLSCGRRLTYVPGQAVFDAVPGEQP